MDCAYTLPDEEVITIKGDFRIKVPELLFNPELDGKECKSIHELCWQSISACDVDVRRDLMANMCLSGGNTMFEGLATRL